MNLFRNISCSLKRLRQKKERGIAALEFALALPIWITLLLGCTDGALMMIQSQRVDRISYTICDIVTQSETVNRADLDKVMLAAGELMKPFSFGADGVVIVTSLYKPAGEATKISWQYTGGGSLGRNSKIGLFGQTPSLPPHVVLNDNENVIIAEVFYNYQPMFLSADMLDGGDVYRVAIYKPRLSPLITPPT